MKRDEEAHAVQVEEDEEPTLFIVSMTVAEPVAVHAHLAAVHLDESMLFVQLKEKGDIDSACWILDSGTTNHMMGVRNMFLEIGLRVHGTIHFGDGSMVNIECRGTILIKCKTSGHKALTGVYYIHHLTANIISLGEFEEATYKIVLHAGYLKLWDRSGLLAAKVKRGQNRLYILFLNIDRPVCLAAQGASPAWRSHARYEHLNFCALRKLAESAMVNGLPEIDHIDQVGDGCLIEK
jgi:hypothetical protein